MKKKRTTSEVIRDFFHAIGRFFADFGKAVASGDMFVRLSLIIMGAGYFRRKKPYHAIFFTIFEAIFVWFAIAFAAPNLAKLGTLGTVKAEVYFNPDTFKNEWNDYDNSFKILLYSIISLAVITMFVFVWLQNAKTAYMLQQMDERGEHIPTLKEDLSSYLDKGYHKTLLVLPLTGITIFTIVPLIVMIVIAFTNYDQSHMPPTALFTWVGWNNFKTLFSDSLTVTFGYSFKKILAWTITWAFFAAFTCYIGGILLALFINNKRTHLKKVWRTFFIAAMAVPQFVSLLLVRNFFADQGIVNTFCQAVGLTDFLKQIGLVPQYLTYIPFLTHPVWAKVTIIIINIWIGIPYLLLIATGVLMNIPAEQYESATIDGANAFQQFKSVTMPFMLTVTAPYLINSVVSNINNFNVIFLLTEGVYETSDQLMANSNARETDLLVTWLYRLTSNYYNYKMAAVIGIMVFVVCAIITLIAFNTVMRGDREERMQ